jgi:hypothetical protein
MSNRITLDHVLVDTGSVDSNGYLAYLDGCLIGVLIQLEPELHGEMGLGRHWYLEAGFGRVAGEPRPPVFPDLDAACIWLDGRTAGVTPRSAEAGQAPSDGRRGTELSCGDGHRCHGGHAGEQTDCRDAEAGESEVHRSGYRYRARAARTADAIEE